MKLQIFSQLIRLCSLSNVPNEQTERGIGSDKHKAIVFEVGFRGTFGFVELERSYPLLVGFLIRAGLAEWPLNIYKICNELDSYRNRYLDDVTFNETQNHFSSRHV